MPLLQRDKAQNIECQDFAPDSEPLTPGIFLDMQNAYPTMKGFQALPGTVPYIANPLPETPIGSTLALYDSAYNKAIQAWAGGVNRLYQPYQNGWIQADQLGSSSFGAVKWRFTQFNNDVIAVGGGTVAPQVVTGPLSTFMPLAGGPPVGASVVLAVNDQVMMFQGPNWYVSALGSDNNWTPNIQTQANSGTLFDFPGDVVAAAQLYRNVIVFKNQAMWLGQYYGGAPVWSFVPIATNTGTWSQECVVTLPDRIAFVGTDDFYTTTGYTPVRIPNRCKEWFFDIADPNYLSNLSGRYDPLHSLVYWYFVSINAPIAGVPDRYVVWNTRVNRWGTGYRNTPSVPSPNTQPGLATGLYFDQNNVLQGLTGAPAAARLQTGWFGDGIKISQFHGFFPRWNVSPKIQSVHMWHAPNVGSAVVDGGPAYEAPDGWFFGRQSDFYHYFQLNFSGVADPVAQNVNAGGELTGYDILYRQAGVR